ncbi:MAG: Deoxyribose-phosphate aldolase, partial [uncultured Gemmatimonadaceae bacterium]
DSPPPRPGPRRAPQGRRRAHARRPPARPRRRGARRRGPRRSRAQPRHRARPRPRAGAAGEPERGGAARGDDPDAAHRQEGVAGRVAAARHHLHRPHHAGRRRHGEQRAAAVREGAAAGAARPARVVGHGRPRAPRRRGVRLPPVGAHGGGGARGVGGPGGGGEHRLPRRPEPARAAGGRDPGLGGGRRARDRHRDHARARAHRQLAGAVRRGAPLPRGVRRRAHEGDPRHRRAGHAHQRRARERGGDAGRRRLHQDEHRQGAGERDAPLRARDGAHDPRLPRADRPPGGVQAGRRHPRRQERARLPRADEGGARRPLAPPRPLPLRRQRAAHRHRAPARALRHRAVQRGAPAPDGV